MKRFWNKKVVWYDSKNRLLKRTRNITFEDIQLAISQWNTSTIKKHPNTDKYPTQKILYIEVNDYIYSVPFEESENEIFLKTIFRTNKTSQKFLRD